MDKISKVYGKWSPIWDFPYVIEKVFSGHAYTIHEVNTGSYIGSINGKYLKNYKPIVTKIKISIT